MAIPLRPDIVAEAEEIVRRHPGLVAAVLFYGSGLRDRDPQAILDLYVLTDDLTAFFGRGMLALAGRALPPNVLFLPSNGEANAGFKVAVMTLQAFAARMRVDCCDTTLWARFCQPCQIVYVRDSAAADAVDAALAAAAATAVHWAIRLGPAAGTPIAYWTALFAATYGAELRVEKGSRAQDLTAYAHDRYAALMAAAPPTDLAVADDGTLRRKLSEKTLRHAARVWKRRRRWGKALNIARLVKALFTFVGGVDYILWKLERHSGQHIALTSWQKRHPLLAAPFVLPSLFKRGIIR